MARTGREPAESDAVGLGTERLVLRHLSMADLDALDDLYADPEVRRYLPDGARTYEERRAEVAWMTDPDNTVSRNVAVTPGMATLWEDGPAHVHGVERPPAPGRETHAAWVAALGPHGGPVDRQARSRAGTGTSGWRHGTDRTHP
jgi:hypothetical protein